MVTRQVVYKLDLVADAARVTGFAFFKKSIDLNPNDCNMASFYGVSGETYATSVLSGT
jgi:hypothetical protein